MVGEGGAHAEEPDEEQLRTLWCGGINEKVTEEVKTFCFHSFISDSSPLAGWLWPGLENILLLTFPMFQFRFCMNCSWMPDLWRGWPYPRTGTQNSRRILGSSSLSMRIVSSLPTTFSTAWSYIEARSGFKTRPQDWVSSACKRVANINLDVYQVSIMIVVGVTVLATTAPILPLGRPPLGHPGLRALSFLPCSSVRH